MHPPPPPTPKEKKKEKEKLGKSDEKNLPITSWCSITWRDRSSDTLSSCANLRAAYKQAIYISVIMNYNNNNNNSHKWVSAV